MKITQDEFRQLLQPERWDFVMKDIVVRRMLDVLCGDNDQNAIEAAKVLLEVGGA